MIDPLLFGLLLALLAGSVVIYFFFLRHKSKLSASAVDEMRRMLWEKGLTARQFRKLSLWKSYRCFGWSAVPNAMYKNLNFAEITTENGEIFYAKVILAFEKKVLEKELKKAGVQRLFS